MPDLILMVQHDQQPGLHTANDPTAGMADRERLRSGTDRRPHQQARRINPRSHTAENAADTGRDGSAGTANQNGGYSTR